MTDKDIKPVPKYILKKIYARDIKSCPWQNAEVRFYAYLTVWKKELVKVTVAVTTKNKQWAYKQVAVHGIHSENCLVRDMEYNYFGGGYRVGWYYEALQTYPKSFEDGNWYTAPNKYYDPYAPLLNRGVIAGFPEYKYSAYMLYKGRDIISYLRLYEKYPQAEYLMKLGLSPYAENISILKKIGKDRAFCKWLIRHRAELSLPWGNSYNTATVMTAYKTNRPPEEVKRFLFRKREFEREKSFDPIRERFPGEKLNTFFNYIDKQNISYRLYLDYLNACNYLQLDMSCPANLMPHDFMRRHDIRIRQYAEAKAAEEERNNAETARKFSAVADKYLSLQHDKRSAFICLIARSPADLIREGEILHHCVGRMNYNVRFAQEESLIFFIRARQQPDIPFVTVEYSLQSKKVLQCYGDHNTKPDSDALHYIHNVWLPYANNQLKQIQTAA